MVEGTLEHYLLSFGSGQQCIYSVKRVDQERVVSEVFLPCVSENPEVPNTTIFDLLSSEQGKVTRETITDDNFFSLTRSFIIGTRSYNGNGNNEPHTVIYRTYDKREFLVNEVIFNPSEKTVVVNQRVGEVVFHDIKGINTETLYAGLRYEHGFLQSNILIQTANSDGAAVRFTDGNQWARSCIPAFDHPYKRIRVSLLGETRNNVTVADLISGFQGFTGASVVMERNGRDHISIEDTLEIEFPHIFVWRDLAARLFA
jgi:hypothetical protein